MKRWAQKHELPSKLQFFPHTIRQCQQHHSCSLQPLASARGRVRCARVLPAQLNYCCKGSDLCTSYKSLKHTTDSGLECVSWMNTAEKTPRNNIFCRRTDTATYSSMTQPWSFPLYEVSTPTVCGVSLCEAAERIFVDEADDLTLKVKAKDCNCAGQLCGSTMTMKDTSVANLTQFSGKN